MPNIVVEYSANIADEADIPGLLKAMTASVISAGQGAFPTAGIRARAYRCDDYVIADGDPSYAFISINVRVARGRSEEDKERTFDAVFEVVKHHLEPVDRMWTLAISMDVEEFGDRLAYKQNRLHEKFGTKPFVLSSGG
jgi:5-carboxymethyl-2-hydroxymuconate isomerase